MPPMKTLLGPSSTLVLTTPIPERDIMLMREEGSAGPRRRAAWAGGGGGRVVDAWGGLGRP